MNTTSKFNVYPHVCVSITSPIYKKRRKSITIVIDYPDYAHNEFTGYFELSIFDVDFGDHTSKPEVLYFDTMREEWEDNDDWRHQEFRLERLKVEEEK